MEQIVNKFAYTPEFTPESTLGFQLTPHHTFLSICIFYHCQLCDILQQLRADVLTPIPYAYNNKKFSQRQVDYVSFALQDFILHYLTDITPELLDPTLSEMLDQLNRTLFDPLGQIIIASMKKMLLLLSHPALFHSFIRQLMFCVSSDAFVTDIAIQKMQYKTTRGFTYSIRSPFYTYLVLYIYAYRQLTTPTQTWAIFEALRRYIYFPSSFACYKTGPFLSQALRAYQQHFVDLGYCPPQQLALFNNAPRLPSIVPQFAAAAAANSRLGHSHTQSTILSSARSFAPLAYFIAKSHSFSALCCAISLLLAVAQSDHERSLQAFLQYNNALASQPLLLTPPLPAHFGPNALTALSLSQFLFLPTLGALARPQSRTSSITNAAFNAMYTPYNQLLGVQFALSLSAMFTSQSSNDAILAPRATRQPIPSLITKSFDQTSRLLQVQPPINSTANSTILSNDSSLLTNTIDSTQSHISPSPFASPFVQPKVHQPSLQSAAIGHSYFNSPLTASRSLAPNQHKNHYRSSLDSLGAADSLYSPASPFHAAPFSPIVAAVLPQSNEFAPSHLLVPPGGRHPSSRISLGSTSDLSSIEASAFHQSSQPSSYHHQLQQQHQQQQQQIRFNTSSQNIFLSVSPFLLLPFSHAGSSLLSLVTRHSPFATFSSWLDTTLEQSHIRLQHIISQANIAFPLTNTDPAFVTWLRTLSYSLPRRSDPAVDAQLQTFAIFSLSPSDCSHLSSPQSQRLLSVPYASVPLIGPPLTLPTQQNTISSSSLKRFLDSTPSTTLTTTFQVLAPTLLTTPLATSNGSPYGGSKLPNTVPVRSQSLTLATFSNEIARLHLTAHSTQLSTPYNALLYYYERLHRTIEHSSFSWFEQFRYSALRDAFFIDVDLNLDQLPPLGNSAFKDAHIDSLNGIQHMPMTSVFVWLHHAAMAHHSGAPYQSIRLLARAQEEYLKHRLFWHHSFDALTLLLLQAVVPDASSLDRFMYTSSTSSLSKQYHPVGSLITTFARQMLLSQPSCSLPQPTIQSTLHYQHVNSMLKDFDLTFLSLMVPVRNALVLAYFSPKNSSQSHSRLSSSSSSSSSSPSPSSPSQHHAVLAYLGALSQAYRTHAKYIAQLSLSNSYASHCSQQYSSILSHLAFPSLKGSSRSHIRIQPSISLLAQLPISSSLYLFLSPRAIDPSSSRAFSPRQLHPASALTPQTDKSPILLARSCILYLYRLFALLRVSTHLNDMHSLQHHFVKLLDDLPSTLHALQSSSSALTTMQFTASLTFILLHALHNALQAIMMYSSSPIAMLPLFAALHIPCLSTLSSSVATGANSSFLLTPNVISSLLSTLFTSFTSNLHFNAMDVACSQSTDHWTKFSIHPIVTHLPGAVYCALDGTTQLGPLAFGSSTLHAAHRLRYLCPSAISVTNSSIYQSIPFDTSLSLYSQQDQLHQASQIATKILRSSSPSSTLSLHDDNQRSSLSIIAKYTAARSHDAFAAVPAQISPFPLRTSSHRSSHALLPHVSLYLSALSTVIPSAAHTTMCSFSAPRITPSSHHAATHRSAFQFATPNPMTAFLIAPSALASNMLSINQQSLVTSPHKTSRGAALSPSSFPLTVPHTPVYCSISSQLASILSTLSLLCIPLNLDELHHSNQLHGLYRDWMPSPSCSSNSSTAALPNLPTTLVTIALQAATMYSTSFHQPYIAKQLLMCTRASIMAMCIPYTQWVSNRSSTSLFSLLRFRQNTSGQDSNVAFLPSNSSVEVQPSGLSMQDNNTLVAQIYRDLHQHYFSSNSAHSSNMNDNSSQQLIHWFILVLIHDFHDIAEHFPAQSYSLHLSDSRDCLYNTPSYSSFCSRLDQLVQLVCHVVDFALFSVSNMSLFSVVCYIAIRALHLAKHPMQRDICIVLLQVYTSGTIPSWITTIWANEEESASATQSSISFKQSSIQSYCDNLLSGHASLVESSLQQVSTEYEPPISLMTCQQQCCYLADDIFDDIFDTCHTMPFDNFDNDDFDASQLLFI